MGVFKQAAAGIGLMWVLNGCAEVVLPGTMAGGGDDFHWFEGQRFGFFKADIGDTSQDVTQSFKCE